MKKHLPAVLAAVLTFAAAASLQAQRPRDNARDNAPGVTIEVRKSGNTLSFDGCVDHRNCRSRPIDVSSPNSINRIKWDVDIEGETIQSVEVIFKNGRTPCFSGRRNGNFRNADRIQGRRRGQQRRVEVFGRIKTRGWSENSGGNSIRRIDRAEYPYRIVVRTAERSQPYDIDPIVIVRGF